MTTKQPLVSIIIPTHNRKRSAERLIKSILKNDYKRIEIVVVDDYSSDGTYEYLSKIFRDNKKIDLVRNKKNLFTAGSRNTGLRKSKGDLIFFVDDDNTLDRKTISVLVEVFNDKKVGEAGPVNYNFNNKKKILWLITYRNMWTTKTYQPRNLGSFSGRKVWDTADIPNAFMVRADILKKNRISFREKFGIMYEESDVAYKIRNLGYSVRVVQDAKIYHDIEDFGTGKKNKDYMYHFMNDKRRPFVFARNRIIFHSIYSSKFQLLFICLIWIWLFAAYYSYKIIYYSGSGEFTLPRRFVLVASYFKGIAEGLVFVAGNKKLTYV